MGFTKWWLVLVGCTERNMYVRDNYVACRRSLHSAIGYSVYFIFNYGKSSRIKVNEEIKGGILKTDNLAHRQNILKAVKYSYWYGKTGCLSDFIMISGLCISMFIRRQPICTNEMRNVL